MAEVKRVYVFDIDNTISNTDHRTHFLRDGKKDWDQFFALQHLDEPYTAVLDVMHSLARTGAHCIIITGRLEKHRDVTMEWLTEHYDGVMLESNLYMRPTNDRTDDDELKFNLVKRLELENPDWKIMAIFDDRHRIIDKFRDAGYYVFECNQKREEF